MCVCVCVRERERERERETETETVSFIATLIDGLGMYQESSKLVVMNKPFLNFFASIL